ncbi:xylose reductase [Sporodiniella umbellata]|nr:xylose reductase [Sporodiniella umbellata]
MQQKNSVTLSRTNQAMPLVGFGTARIPLKDVAEVVYNAIKTGYRMIDGALIYGNELQIGQGIQKAISEGIVQREDLFIISKLWNSYHHKDNVKKAMQASLKNLGLSYVDLYLVHFPVSDVYMDPESPVDVADCFRFYRMERSPFHECWKSMESLVDEGLARNIGISNFNVQSILDLLTYCRYKPAVLEIEHHLYLQQKRLINWVISQGIHIVAFASLGPTVYGDYVPDGIKGIPQLMKNPTILQMAQKYQCDSAQIMLKWAVQRNITVIPKTVNINRMKSNRDLFSFTIDPKDMKSLESFERGARFCDIVPEIFGIDLPLFS